MCVVGKYCLITCTQFIGSILLSSAFKGIFRDQNLADLLHLKASEPVQPVIQKATVKIERFPDPKFTIFKYNTSVKKK